MGSRLDLIILDDVLDFENTLHPTGRKRIIDWFDSSVESRSTAFGRIWAIGTAWNREDLMHVLAKRPGWQSKRYDGSAGDLWPELVMVDGKPSGWPKWRIEEKRDRMPALEFNRQFRNLPLSEASEIFNTESIERCFDPELEYDPEPLPEWSFYVGVDLNIKKGEARHKTAFFVVRWDGEVKTVQRIVADNMQLDEILYWFTLIETRYHPVIFLVENNGGQDYIVQLWQPNVLKQVMDARGLDPTPILNGPLPRIEGFMTGSNKSDPTLGIRGMTIEFEQRRWRIPEHRLTREWKDEMLNFDPIGHTGDILMSSWLCHSATLKYRPRRIRGSRIGVR